MRGGVVAIVTPPPHFVGLLVILVGPRSWYNRTDIIQSFQKFLAGGEFRHFKINQFEKIIKSLLSSFLTFCR